VLPQTPALYTFFGFPSRTLFNPPELSHRDTSKATRKVKLYGTVPVTFSGAEMQWKECGMNAGFLQQQISNSKLARVATFL
jgi:hypothetical protein